MATAKKKKAVPQRKAFVFNKQLTKNFHVDEFRCHDGTGVPYDLIENVIELAENLQVLRDFIDAAIDVISGYRNPTYNRLVAKGAADSMHMKAKAGDLQTEVLSPRQLYDVIEKLIKAGKMKQGGLGLYATFVHYDTRGTKARWKG